MTSIFAYVNGDRAIVAADTLRRDLLGMFPNQTVRKVFCWADCVPFAGVWNGPRLSKLAAKILEAQSNYPPDEAGFIAAFNALRPAHYASATSGNSAMTSVPSLSQGTFLVAVPSMNGSLEKLFELDFATGAQTALASRLAALGTDPQGFLSIAQRALISRRTQAGLASDLWAGDCISGAIGICPRDVGMPFDVALVGPAPAGSWRCCLQRFSAPPQAGDAAYLV